MQTMTKMNGLHVTIDAIIDSVATTWNLNNFSFDTETNDHDLVGAYQITLTASYDGGAVVSSPIIDFTLTFETSC